MMKTKTVSKWITALALTAGGALLATSAVAQSGAGTSPATSPGADTKSSTSQPAASNSPSAPGATTGSTGSEQKSGEMKAGAMKSGTSRDSAQSANREQVKAVQQALKDKGHDPGDVDGAMGPKTQAALRDFQQKEGLKATGRADSDTMAKLAVATNTDTADKSSTAPAASPSGGSSSGSPSSTGASKDATSTGAKQSK
jgi:peptidoglycan hydrolase-like protein with peptidoglycan-binding domain